MSTQRNSLEIISPPSSPSNDELRMRRRAEKLKEEANAAGERYKVMKVSGTKEEARAAYNAYQARADDYRRARKEYESSYGAGEIEMRSVGEAAGTSTISKPSTAAGGKSVGPTSPSTSRVDLGKAVETALVTQPAKVADLKTKAEGSKIKSESSKVSDYVRYRRLLAEVAF